jgi:broad specificity phosphatase PhoE
MVKTPTGIPTDPPLTSKGVEQSKELAEYLCNIEPPVERVYSSPFYRCLQTLKPTTDRLFREGNAQGKIRIDRGVGYVKARLWSFHMHDYGTIADAGGTVSSSDAQVGSTRLPQIWRR